MNDKARSDSKLNRLPPEQQARVKHWLFAENQSYTAVAQRCCGELKLTLDPSSVKRYYLRHKPAWELAQKLAAAEVQTDPDPTAGERNYRRLLDQMIQIALEMARATDDPASLRVVANFAKVSIAARRESHEALRAATTREKFEFDAATECLIHQTQAQSIAKDPSLDDAQRIQNFRQELFGPNLSK